MKALTLTQPWAQLVALGAKRYETRRWSTDYRGPLAIHAAKGLKPVGGEAGLRQIVQRAPFYRALGAGRVDDLLERLPFGAIVAAVELVDVIPTLDVRSSLSREELVFGDFSPGRFAWELDSYYALPEPVPAKGELTLWTVSDAHVRQIQEQLAGVAHA